MVFATCWCIFVLYKTVTVCLTSCQHFVCKGRTVCMYLFTLSMCAGLRPERPSRCDDDCWQLMQRCWDADASSRPHIGELEQSLHSIYHKASVLPPQPFTVTLNHDEFTAFNGDSFTATTYLDTLSILQWWKSANCYCIVIVQLFNSW